MIGLAQPWLKPIDSKSFLLIGFGVFFLAASLEFPWRKIVLTEDVVRERLWFHWRTHDLPYRVMVGRDNRGRIVVAEAPTGRIVVRFIREFGRPAAIERQLLEFFEASGRLAI